MIMMVVVAVVVDVIATVAQEQQTAAFVLANMRHASTLCHCNWRHTRMLFHSHVISLADAALVLGPVNRSALGLAAAARVRISHSDATTGDWCLASGKAAGGKTQWSCERAFSTAMQLCSTFQQT
jgi:hypothetical protein